MSAYINKTEFEKKLRDMRTKYAVENNTTLMWVIYITICLAGLLLLVGTTILVFTVMILFLVGLPFAFLEGVIKGIGKNND